MRRLTVANLLAIVAIIGVGFGTLRNPTLLALQLTEGIAFLCLLIGLVGAFARPAPRGAWQGFAVFGWVYFLMANSYLPTTADVGDMGGAQIFLSRKNAAWKLPTAGLVDELIGWLHHELRPPSRPSFAIGRTPETDLDGHLYWESLSRDHIPLTDQESAEWKAYEADTTNLQYVMKALIYARRIAHAQLGLALGLFGAIVGRYLGRARPIQPESLQSTIPPTEQR